MGGGVGADITFDVGTAGVISVVVKPSVDNTVTDLVGRDAGGDLIIVEAASINLGITDNEVVVGTGTGVEGDSNFTWDATTLLITAGNLTLAAGNLSITGTTALIGATTVTGELAVTIDLLLSETNSAAVGLIAANKGAIYLNDGSDSLGTNVPIYKDESEVLFPFSFEDALNNDLVNGTSGAITHDGSTEDWELQNVGALHLSGTSIDIEASAATGGQLTLGVGTI